VSERQGLVQLSESRKLQKKKSRRIDLFWLKEGERRVNDGKEEPSAKKDLKENKDPEVERKRKVHSV